MVSCFVAGLKKEVQLGVQMFRPISLAAATSLTRLQEEKNMANKRFQRPDTNMVGMTNSSEINKGPIPFQSKSNIPPIKMLSSAEMNERREKGLCYNCDDEYSSGHHCKMQ